MKIEVNTMCLRKYVGSLFLSLTLVSCALNVVNAKDSGEYYQTYFLSIGSENYLHKPDASKSSHSAERIADELKKSGSRYGIILTSKAGSYVGREDIRKAITDLKQHIRQDKPANPLVIFYYMGHGYGYADNRFMFLKPGNFIPDGNLNQTNMFRFFKTALWNYDVINSFVMFRMPSIMAKWDDIFMSDLMPDISDFGSIMQTLQKKSELISWDEETRAAGKYPKGKIPPVPYIILFDNCYGGTEADLYNKSGENFKSVFSGLNSILINYLDKTVPQIEDEGLVLYAVSPGERASTIMEPELRNSKKNSRTMIGPLARRFLIVLDEARKDQLNLSFRNFVQRMMDSKLDVDERGASQKPISYSAPKDSILDKMLFGGKVQANDGIDIRYGTASAPIHCCGIPIR